MQEIDNSNFPDLMRVRFEQFKRVSKERKGITDRVVRKMVNGGLEGVYKDLVDGGRCLAAKQVIFEAKNNGRKR